ncbi:TetR/AcrR family transcriptional regulator [Rhizohabitans arisaemae]|uniref:TetR/AcrR family transcriptional regulator n=1 Tax=Rhizohabitans arisaemae TaxID=2720610 RepID=UPI0024B0D1FF|nr:TetR family transcriptional regulator C-terminal domain-containing protein [Rhizohabitans arisaemae]
MPKIVDHDKRRAELVAAAWRVIARVGLAQTTTREIAKDAGYANGVLAHYFPDKEAILDLALRLALKSTTERIGEWVANHSGLEALRGALLLSLPLDDSSRLGIEVEVSFWGRAVGNPERSTYQHKSLLTWHKLLSSLVKNAIESGELRTELDPDRTADLLVALVDGLSVEGVLFREAYPNVRLAGIVDSFLDLLRATSVASRM